VRFYPRFFRSILLLSLLTGAKLMFANGQLESTPSSVNFGTIPVGSSENETLTLSNVGTTRLAVQTSTISGTGFTISHSPGVVVLFPGQSASLTVTFTPQSSGTVTGTLYVVATIAVSSSGQRTNQTTSIALSGTGGSGSGGQLNDNPSSLNFGNVQVGSSSSQYETLTNAGGSSVTITQASASGTGFSISGLNVPITLTSGESITFTAEFAPLASGSDSGSISIVSNASDPDLTIAVSGTGVATGQLSLTPTSLNFGDVNVGSSSTLPATMTASGASITVSSDTISNSEYSLSGVSFPLTIAAGQSVSFSVTFTPQTSGSASGTASLYSNASNSPGTESLSGTGMTATYSTALSWDASTSQVVGYYVYRGSQSGGPYSKLNSAPDPNTSYTDNSVQTGQTYYYVTTAVNNSGQESSYSNQVTAVIP